MEAPVLRTMYKQERKWKVLACLGAESCPSRHVSRSASQQSFKEFCSWFSIFDSCSTDTWHICGWWLDPWVGCWMCGILAYSLDGTRTFLFANCPGQIHRVRFLSVLQLRWKLQWLCTSCTISSDFGCGYHFWCFSQGWSWLWNIIVPKIPRIFVQFGKRKNKTDWSLRLLIRIWISWRLICLFSLVWSRTDFWEQHQFRIDAVAN